MDFEINRDSTVLVKFDGFDLTASEFFEFVDGGNLFHPDAVRCIQPTRGGFLVSLHDRNIARNLIKSTCVSVDGRNFYFDHPDKPKSYVKIYGLPFEVTGEQLCKAMSDFGEIFNCKFDKYPGRPYYNGDRTLAMHVAREIPRRFKVGPFVVTSYYRGQVKACNHCNDPGHLMKDCPELVCHNCKEIGHFARVCPMRKCSLCAGFGHFARQCTNTLGRPSTSRGPATERPSEKSKDVRKDGEPRKGKQSKKIDVPSSMKDVSVLKPRAPPLTTANRFGTLTGSVSSEDEDDSEQCCMDIIPPSPESRKRASDGKSPALGKKPSLGINNKG